MIRKTLILLVLSAFTVSSEEFTQDFVLKPFYGKTPAFIMKQFGRPLDFKELTEVGLNRWTHEVDERGKEELLTYKLVLVDKKWTLKKKRVFSFQADFYRPLGSEKNVPFVCWDAFYVLTPIKWDRE
ncbi:MAG: hypothetical protein H8E05_01300 [Bacteroidetes bacterium]|nr:hypothetical protein [Bacteroidota bacterium]